jgi:hypothetical protein
MSAAPRPGGSTRDGSVRRWTAGLCQWLLQRLAPREVGALFERLQVQLAGQDPRIGAYALEFNNPQAVCFLIDAYPTLQKLFARYPRMGTIRFLDIGPAFGAAAGLVCDDPRAGAGCLDKAGPAFGAISPGPVTISGPRSSSFSIAAATCLQLNPTGHVQYPSMVRPSSVIVCV